MPSGPAPSYVECGEREVWRRATRILAAAAEPASAPATASANGTTSGQLWLFAKMTSTNRIPIANPTSAPRMPPSTFTGLTVRLGSLFRNYG